MGSTNFENRIQRIKPLFHFRWKAMSILLIGFLVTSMASFYMYYDVRDEAKKEFELICTDLKTRIDARLKAHALLLRSGAAFFAASDSVSRDEWMKFIKNSRYDRNLPGIQGVGYSIIVPQFLLKQHEHNLQKSGFINYKIFPQGKRDLYTSIVYLEPFTERNTLALGYDMFSEPVRRKAMETARDSDIAMLSGKVILVQEKSEKKQAGTLMFVPVYNHGMPINNATERRIAIKGWVYSPYRMNDLMDQVLGNWEMDEKSHISLLIYDDDNITTSGLLYESKQYHLNKARQNSNLIYRVPIVFNGKMWTLIFYKYNPKISVFHGKVIILLLSGLIISLLVYAFSVVYLNTRIRARHIAQLNKQLEKINSDKDTFISVLAHDLRNPFNTLIGFSELLVRNIKKYDTNQLEFKALSIYKTAKQTFNLLNELLIWARSQAGKLPFEPQILQLSEIYNEIYDGLEIIAESKEITINYTQLSETAIFADANMLKTILRNLISNAIKFTNFGGKVDVYAEQGTLDVLVKVSDNGIGIRDEIVDRLFNFSENHVSVGTAEEKGTGWGLKLCMEFIIQHEGKIWVKSEPGRGSDFFITLPNKPGQ